MKRIVSYLTALAAGISLCGTLAFAQHGGAGGAHGAAGGMGSEGGTGRGMGQGADKSGGKMGSGEAMGKTPSQLLTQNTKLSSKLQSLLPAGTDLQQAASGFKNLGQFVAAVHVAHNLGIPFDELKAKMIGPPSESLGKAIHALKPEANAKAETKKANSEARDDIHETETTS